MTVLVAVLNRSGVAIAADSASNVYCIDRERLHNTIDKIFRLSGEHKVGFMICGEAELMGIPWEDIVSMYNNSLSKKPFKNLISYRKNFVEFLNDNDVLKIPKERQLLNLNSRIDNLLNDISADFEQKCNDENINIEGKEAEYFASYIDEWNREFKDSTDKEYWESTKLDDLRKNKIFKKFISDVLHSLSEKIDININIYDKIEMLVYYFLVKYPPNQENYDGFSQIVITGYGTKDLFPYLYEIYVYDKIFDQLQYVFPETLDSKRLQEINFGCSGYIYASAQTTMITSFLDGIHPDYREELEFSMKQYFEEHLDTMTEETKDLKIGEPVKQILINKNKEFYVNTTNKFINFHKDIRINHFWKPLLQSVATLPKKGLAYLAENLVDLELFRERILQSPGIKPIMGPIDVAVISKSDGFVWVKKKNYFDPELNPHKD